MSAEAEHIGPQTGAFRRLRGTRARFRAGLPLARRLLSYLLPYRGRVFLAMLCAIAQAGLTLIPLIILKILINRLRTHHPQVGPLIPLVLAGIASSAVVAVLGVASTYLQQSITEGIVCDLRDQLFANLIDQTVGFWVTRRGGEVISRIINDVAAIDSLLAAASLTLWSAVLTGGAVTVLMFVLSWQLAIATLIVLPIGFLPLRGAGKRIGLTRLRVQEQLALVTGYLQEVLGVSGAELVRAHNRRGFERDRFSVLNRELRKREVAAAMSARWFNASVTTIGAAGPAILTLIGAFLVAHAGLSLGSVLVVALLLSTRLGTAMQSAAVTITDLLASVPVWKRIFTALDEEPEIIESPDALEIDPAAITGAIELESVSFTYPGQTRPAIDDVSLTIQPGQLVAIVGPTGAGKSTLAALIARLADPHSGTVRLDGHDLRDLTFDTVAGAIGVVFQDNFLFHAPLAENLRYAQPDATDEELWEAIRAAQLEPVVQSLPDGLESLVGERGHRLSGGEQQRVAIARAILENPRVLILDEATSNLDRIVEREVQQAMERLFADRTTVVIAHRLSTIRDADVILVMRGGRIVESGRHEELLDDSGLYSRLYEAQASGIG